MTFKICSTVLLTSSIGRVFPYAFFYSINVEYRNSLSVVDKWKCVMRKLGTIRTRSLVFRYILNLQADVKWRKLPLQYGYRPSSAEMHFPVRGTWTV